MMAPKIFEKACVTIQNQRKVPKTGMSLNDMAEMITPIKDLLLGLDYIYGVAIDKFYCTLCDKKFSMNQVVSHASGNSHSRKFCARSFPELAEKLDKLCARDQHGPLGHIYDFIAVDVSRHATKNFPTIYQTSSDFQEDSQENFIIKSDHFNYPHVNKFTVKDLETKLIEMVAKKVNDLCPNEIEYFNASKDKKAKAPFIANPAVDEAASSVAVDAIRARPHEVTDESLTNKSLSQTLQNIRKNELKNKVIQLLASHNTNVEVECPEPPSNIFEATLESDEVDAAPQVDSVQEVIGDPAIEDPSTSNDDQLSSVPPPFIEIPDLIFARNSMKLFNIVCPTILPKRFLTEALNTETNQYEMIELSFNQLVY